MFRLLPLFLLTLLPRPTDRPSLSFSSSHSLKCQKCISPFGELVVYEGRKEGRRWPFSLLPPFSCILKPSCQCFLSGERGKRKERSSGEYSPCLFLFLLGKSSIFPSFSFLAEKGVKDFRLWRKKRGGREESIVVTGVGEGEEERTKVSFPSLFFHPSSRHMGERERERDRRGDKTPRGEDRRRRRRGA